jgi:hypothetical protein
MNLLTPDEYDQIRTRTLGTSEGPWSVRTEERRDHAILRILDRHGRIVASTVACLHDDPDALNRTENDLLFIAYAHQWATSLLDEVAALTERLRPSP